MTSQELCTLNFWLKQKPSLRAQIILNVDYPFVKFLNECVMNVLLGNVSGVVKKDLKDHQSWLTKLSELNERQHRRKREHKLRQHFLSKPAYLVLRKILPNLQEFVNGR